MLSCSIWFSAPSFWMGGGLERPCAGRVCGADGAVHGNIRTLHTTHSAALKTTTHPKTGCRKPYAATQHLMLLIIGYVPETCRTKNTSIKLPFYIKLTFHIIS